MAKKTMTATEVVADAREKLQNLADDKGVTMRFTAGDGTEAVIGPSETEAKDPQRDGAERDHEENLRRMERDIARLAVEMARTKAKASSLKNEHDALTDRYAAAVNAGPEHLPLLDGAKPAGDEAWRDVEVCTLDIADGIVAALHDAGIKTIGDLAGWTASGERLTDILKIGSAKAEAIEKALEKFWAQQQQASDTPLLDGND